MSGYAEQIRSLEKNSLPSVPMTLLLLTRPIQRYNNHSCGKSVGLSPPNVSSLSRAPD